MDKYSKAKRSLLIFLLLFILVGIAYYWIDWYLQKNNIVTTVALLVEAALLYLPIVMLELIIVSVGNVLKYYKDGIYKFYSKPVLCSGYGILIWGLIASLVNGLTHLK